MSDPEGLAMARQWIAEEKEQKTGFLDLGFLGLTEFPDELWELTHLERLSLGWSYVDNVGNFHQARGRRYQNQLSNELSRLNGLPQLRCLSVRMDEFADLSSLLSLSRLESLDCRSTSVRDLSSLSGLFRLQSLNCSRTSVSDLSPLSSLSALRSLNCSYTSVSNLSPLSNLSELQSLNCSCTSVSNLSPLSNLSKLQSLNCSYSAVSDLSPLSKLSKLRSLNCSRTSVSDLYPLSGLSELQSVNCSYTSASELSPLSCLSLLQELTCYNTMVSSLSSLSRLFALRSLNCSYTSVNDLSSLSGLSALETLTCRNTPISDLSPLSGLFALQSLDCSQSLVNSLSPLAKLPKMRSLACSQTSVSDLSPLVHTSSLLHLHVSRCVLSGFPIDLLTAMTARRLYLFETKIPGIPSEVLSQRSHDDCRQRFLDHLNDLAVGAELLPDVKVVVLGNGRIGKTQICRRLRGDGYDESVDSTHGIVVTQAELPIPDQLHAVMNLWDFGGQDLYHGTHALFLKSRAVLIVVWTPRAESTREYEHGGMRFRNQPLPYWLDYVRHAAGNVSPVVLIQNQCDTPQDELLQSPATPELLQQFPYLQQVHYSAKADRKRATLDDALREAIAHLRQREGVATIGKGRLRVRQQLQQWLDEDASREPERRQHRTLTQQQFRDLCEQTGGISSPESLLEYLHNAGVVFYRRGLFDDAIVLDQSWALDALYTVFHRQQCYRQLETLGGRFTRSLLETLAWPDYSVSEQQLFLSLMESCGICFQHRTSDSRRGAEIEYVAPDLLPVHADVASQLAGRWDDAAPTMECAWRYEFLHPGLIRSIISLIGKRAGQSAVYWKYGVWFYDAHTRAQAIISQQMQDDRRGRIVLQTQGDRRRDLLLATAQWIAESITKFGDNTCTLEGEPLTEVCSSEPPSPRFSDEDPAGDHGPAAAKIRITDPPRPADERRAYVSYAWKEETSSDKDRAGKVEAFCHKLTDAGRRIVRDTTHVAIGDKLSSFMRQIGHGDRVYVFLSDAYLKSANCMYELLTIWQTSGDDEAKFRQRTRVYTMPGTNIFSMADRLKYAAHWKRERDSVNEIIQQSGVDVLGPTDLKHFKNIQEFAHNVNEMLAQIADILQPRDFDQYIDRAIDELRDNA